MQENKNENDSIWTMNATREKSKFLLIKQEKKRSATHNKVGIINCLRQPGQICNQPKKSMRVNLMPLIKLSLP